MVEGSPLEILGVNFISGIQTVINAVDLNLGSAAPGRHNTSEIPAGSSTSQPLLSALSFGAGMETQGGKRIRRGVAPPKRNFSKTGETQDLESSIIIYYKRWG